MILVLAVGFGVIGVLATRRRAVSLLALGLAAVGAFCAATRPTFAGVDLIPSLVAGVAAWLALRWIVGKAAPRASAIGRPMPGAYDRRNFLMALGLTASGAAAGGLLARVGGRAGKAVEQARAGLRIPPAPASLEAYPAMAALPAVTANTSAFKGFFNPWRTPNAAFYRIDTALVVPAVDPAPWRLKIGGMVDHPLEFDLAQLMQRPVDHAWVSLTCVSNPVGGNLAGNALWTGTRIAPILAECGIQAGADAVLQTSDDGWTCATPIEALTDDRNALLAYGMNGDPLPRQHGFPLRMVVPGLYGYVSATKWLVELEVTSFDKVTAYWTERGWSEKGPIKLESRIDTPNGSAEEGDVLVTGTSWMQHTGISKVQVRVDNGEWHDADLGGQPTKDSWRLWSWQWADATEGDHTLQCRAVDALGRTQTEELADVVPDGATGWHTVSCTIVAKGKIHG
jgi:DMSO/TMAO reductase YedYZ molybdopterin-dependent catalytic subunit